MKNRSHTPLFTPGDATKEKPPRAPHQVFSFFLRCSTILPRNPKQSKLQEKHQIFFSCTSFSLASSLLFLLGLCFSLRICEECLRASSGIIFMKCCLSMCSCCCRRRISSGILLRRTSAVLLPSQSFLQHDVVVFSCMIFSSFSRRESTQPKPKFRTFCKWVGGFCTA